MTKVRQLPEVFLRGSLANETMKSLTEDQRLRVDQLSTEIANHPCLAGHKHEFVFRLRTTIACDYNDDNTFAQEEFNIAIWRAVVHLLYHRDYTYKCKRCKKGSYTSQTGKNISFNRRYEICPACGYCEVEFSGSSELEEGTFVDFDVFQEISESFRERSDEPPLSRSCIKSIPGKPKVVEPEKMLKDTQQVSKYFSTWVWNYFRQILLENKITYHDKKSVPVSGTADVVLAEVITNLFGQNRIEFHYSPEEIGADGHEITCYPLTAPPTATIKLTSVLDSLNSDRRLRIIKARLSSCYERKLLGIGISLIMTPLKVAICTKAHKVPFVKSEITVNREVQVVNNVMGNKRTDDNDVLDTTKQLEQPAMYPDKGTPAVDSFDSLHILRDNLPDMAQKVFDLITNGSVGDIDGTYADFAERYPESTQVNHGIPRQNRMAEFLCCTPKDIKRCQESIRTQMMAMSYVPG